jgi:hypothetical protein
LTLEVLLDEENTSAPEASESISSARRDVPRLGSWHYNPEYLKLFSSGRDRPFGFPPNHPENLPQLKTSRIV